MHKEAFEPTGLIPRSIIRTFDRFRQQLLPGTEQIAIQEYRISRYQILVSIKALCTLIFVPFFVTYTVKFFLITPLTEHFWDYQQGDIFLNSYQEKRAFNEMRDFSEKIFFESLVNSNNQDSWDCDRSRPEQTVGLLTARSELQPRGTFELKSLSDVSLELPSNFNQIDLRRGSRDAAPKAGLFGCAGAAPLWGQPVAQRSCAAACTNLRFVNGANKPSVCYGSGQFAQQLLSEAEQGSSTTIWLPNNPLGCSSSLLRSRNKSVAFVSEAWKSKPNESQLDRVVYEQTENKPKVCYASAADLLPEGCTGRVDCLEEPRTTLNLQIRFQKKSLEIAETYNKQSILAITSLLGDFVTILTLYILFVLPQMKPQVIILKSFLTESLYSLSDTTKSFLLILGMDLLVGFHSPRGWEIVLETALRRFGLPENESFILLFVALFPVFLDTVFKYWIFRYLNKISPSTVVTYHSMLE